VVILFLIAAVIVCGQDIKPPGTISGDDWKFISAKDGIIHFYHTPSIMFMDKDIATIWSKKSFTHDGKKKYIGEIREGWKGKQEDIDKIDFEFGFYEVHCHTREFRPLTIFYFDREGNMIYRKYATEREPLKPVMPGTELGDIYPIICKKK